MARNSTPKNPNRPADKGLKVVSRRATFCRGGHQFTAEGRTIALRDLTAEQEQQIRAEGEPGGQLVVADVDIEPEGTEAIKA